MSQCKFKFLNGHSSPILVEERECENIAVALAYASFLCKLVKNGRTKAGSGNGAEISAIVVEAGGEELVLTPGILERLEADPAFAPAAAAAAMPPVPDQQTAL